MTDTWTWDETLFGGSAPYYERGRLPYTAALAGAMTAALGLDGTGRLLDVGCGPGTVALRVAHLFREVTGVDADGEMLAEAERRAAALGVRNARWVRLRAEELPAGLGAFEVATFAQSFHWMDRDLVARRVRAMLMPGGAFVQISTARDALVEWSETLPYPPPPYEAIGEIVRRYLGPKRRAGQSVRETSPGNEAAVLARAGYAAPEITTIPGGEAVERSVDDVLAYFYSSSSSAPHLFGDAMGAFDADVRALLAAASPAGRFAELIGETEIRVWRTPLG